MYDFVKYEKRDKPYKFLTLSFDDGITQDREYVKMLNHYGLKCTFNLNSGLFGHHDILPLDRPVNHFKIDAEEVLELYKGHEVAVHSLTHPRLDMVSHEQLLHEVNDDKANLERLSGQKIIGMAYPGGPFYNDEVIKVIKDAGIIYSRDTKATENFHLPDNLIIWQPTAHLESTPTFDRLIDEFINLEPTQDCLFYIWGHSYEFDYNDIWEYVDKVLSRLSGRDDVTYATNGEIAEYITSNRG